MSAAAEVAAKDPAIKLFGWTIAVPECHDQDDASERLDLVENDVRDIRDEVNDGDIRDVPDELHQKETNSTSDINDGHDNDQQACVLNEGELPTDDKPEAANANTASQEKTLKKPDKILPCPRCNSMETKFCYYNNYNVNQPRHFCKNCQRYWTAGGTMRNVPVGAGRRKNKHSVSHYRQLMMSPDGAPSSRADISEIAQGQVVPCRLSTPADSLKGNGTVLKFGPEVPLCESMASVLSLEDQKRKTEVKIMASEENVRESFRTSSGAASNCMGKDISENPVQLEQNANLGSCNGPNGLPIMQPLQCYHGPPWAYPWNPAWNNVSALPAIANAHEVVYGQETNTIPWCQPPMMVAPAFCAPAIPFPYIPAPFWGYMSSWPNGACNAPWVGGACSSSSSTASASSSSGCSDSQSPRLGKHSRDGNPQGGEKTEKSLWVPKTLRIDDPDAASKSSIWATLGIQLDQKEPLTKGGLFKSFHSGHEGKDQKLDSSHVLNANPAALDRSNTFQEST